MARHWRGLTLGLSLLALLCAALPAAAESVLDRVSRTGVLKAGTRDLVRPFAFRDASGQFVGFSVDLIHAFHRALEQRLDREITLEIIQVDAQSRISKVADGSLDISCDIASKTWARDAVIDFSLTIFFNGTRILTERQFGLAGLPALQGKRVGVIANSSTITVIRKTVPGAEIVPFADMNQAMAALEAGEVEGISNISIILRGLQRRASQPGRYVVLPRADYLNAEPMACILPQNDSPWRDFIDRTLVRLMDGVEEYRGPYFEIYQKWFGPDGDLHYPLNQEAIRHLTEIRSWIDD